MKYGVDNIYSGKKENDVYSNGSDEWADDSEDDDNSEENYDDEEDNECLADDNGVETEDYEGMMSSPEQEEDEVYTWDSLDNA